jgi:hypothetical protein
MVGQMDLTWALALVSFLSGGAGAYLGGYLKKKGENLATHEDINRLVDQVSAVTKATKEIEAKISNEVWERQTRWEVQKGAILDTLRDLAGADGLLWRMVWAFKKYPTESATDAAKREEAQNEYMAAIHAFWRSKLSTSIVCGKRISDQLAVVDNVIGRIRNKTIERDFAGAWGLAEEAEAGKRKLGQIIREELRFEIKLDPSPQSSESSAKGADSS